MSTYYYLACKKCLQHVGIWGRWVGGEGPLANATKHPAGVQKFIYDHEPHEIQLLSEHTLPSESSDDAYGEFDWSGSTPPTQ